MLGKPGWRPRSAPSLGYHEPNRFSARRLPKDIAIKVIERNAKAPEIGHQVTSYGLGIRTVHGDPDYVLGGNPILHVDFVLT